MKIFAKRILALSVCSALIGSSAHAATYEVIDKGAADTHKYTFAQQENNLGEMVISGTQAFNFSVQYQYLDSDDFDRIIALAEVNHEALIDINNIEDEAALRAGNPTENDAFWAIQYLRSDTLRTNLGYQKYGDIAALINLNGVTEEVTIFDARFEETGELTRSTIDDINGITDKGWIYGSGSAPYLPVSITLDQNNTDTSDDLTTNYWVRDFITRGFYSLDRGQTIIPLMAPESTYGGISAVSDISETGIAIGFASTSVSENVTDFITDNCSTEAQLQSVPLIVCIDLVLRNNQLTLNDLYSTEAFKWTINDSGVIEQSETLGYLITPHVDDGRGLRSVAQAVNDSGTVVGYSDGWILNDVVEPRVNEPKTSYAVVFKNGEVVDLDNDHETFFRSRANDINNQDIVVGHLETTISGSTRDVFYYADVSDISNIELVKPNSFFIGSSASAKGINEKGFIVGTADIESKLGNVQRRTNAFIYKIGDAGITNLNDALGCDSPYTIIDAKSINDNNEVAATALVKINAKDFFGNDIIDSNNDPVMEEVVRAVKLQPIVDGVIEDCGIAAEDRIERQGASLGVFTPLILLIVGFRRKFTYISK